jgi:hypothetical protein
MISISVVYTLPEVVRWGRDSKKCSIYKVDPAMVSNL